jgi:hypothetical protein
LDDQKRLEETHRNTAATTATTDQSMYMIESINKTLPEIEGNQKTYWKQVLPKGSREIVLYNTASAGFFLMIHILETHRKMKVSIDTVKKFLIREYNKYMDSN